MEESCDVPGDRTCRHNLYIHCNGSKFVSDDCLSCDGPLSSSSVRY
jgi:hypothetical protein